MRAKLKVYTFKDSMRVWWKLRIKRLTTFKTEAGSKHYEWEYTLSNGEGSDESVIYIAHILGQYDHEPDVYDCMMDYLHHQNSVAIGFSKHGQDITDTVSK